MTRQRILELTVLYPVAGILILAAIAAVLPVSWNDHPRLHANETAAIANLRNAASAQSMFVAARAVDVDGDGAFEYGTFRELSGAGDLRADPARGRLDPPMLSGAFKFPDSNGVITRSGYCFRILLPGADGQPVCPDASDAAWATVEPAPAAKAFLMHAWPLRYEAGKRRTFLVNQDGRVFATDHGATLGPRGPDPAAGLHPEASANLLGAIADGTPDATGHVWTEVW